MFSLLYDLTVTQSTQVSKFHGGGIYAEIVFHSLLKKYDNSKCKIFAVFDSRRYFNKELQIIAQKHGVELIDINYITLSDIFKMHKISKFYSSEFSCLFLDKKIFHNFDHVEMIVTVHGVRDLEMPFEKIIYFYMGIKRSVKEWIKVHILPGYKQHILKIRKNRYENFFTGKIKVVTVSQHSKASILSFFPQMTTDKIKVFSAPSFDSLEAPPPLIRICQKDSLFLQRRMESNRINIL